VLERLVVQNFVALPAPAFRLELARRAGLMDEELWFLADWKLWAGIIRHTRVAVAQEPLTAFRIHAASQTSRRTGDDAELRRQYEHVIGLIRTWLPDGATSRRAVSAARLNMAVCLAMALWSHGQRGRALGTLLGGNWWQLPAWPRFLRDSRITDRVPARLRAGALK
jgi:hypothetical protein